MSHAPDHRQQLLHDWLTKTFPDANLQVHVIHSDASFRRYFRVHVNQNQYVAMDAPPEKENTAPFIAISKGLQTHLTVPHVLAMDETLGFLLLTDLGDTLALDHLRADTQETFYQHAIRELSILNNISAIPDYTIPQFDNNFIARELGYFQEWFLDKYLQIQLNVTQQNELRKVFSLLTDALQSQPQTFSHMDFHSRNLMLTDDKKLGIIDFQDAKLAPYTYDLVSLLKDCYIVWPREVVIAHIHYFREARQLQHLEINQIIRDFDITGLQRHLKVLGIFSRLFIRDHKPRYLRDMPRVLNYVREVVGLYPEFKSLALLIDDAIAPRFKQVQT